MLKYSTYNSIYNTQPISSAPVAASSRTKLFARRRQLLRVLLLLAVLSLTCSGIIQVFAASTGSNSSPVYETVVVTSGDTLWEIAVDHKPAGMDTRKYVRKLQALNHLQGSEIAAGDVIKLPDFS